MPYVVGSPVKSKAGVTYLLRVEFATDDAAPVTSPYAGEVGSVTITDTGNNVSVSGGELLIPNRVSYTDPVVYSAITRAQGVVTKTKTDGTLSFAFGLEDGITNPPTETLTVTNTAIADNDTSITNSLETDSLGVNQFAFVYQSTGGYIFRLVSGNWRLIWLSVNNANNLTFAYRLGSGGSLNVDYIRAWQLAGSAFTTLDALAQLDQASPSSGTDYTGTADMLADLVCTQDGSPTAGEKIQLIYRKSDANNYWVAYLERNGGNTDWDLKLDSVASGTPTNRATATSVGTVTRIRVLTVGTSHKVFTYSGSAWTTRGTVTVSHNDAQTTINATYDAGNTVSRLISFRRESANYSELDNG